MSMKSLWAAVLILLVANQVWAWGDDGHAAIGRIAELNLTPAAKLMIQDLIGIEPLSITATWADHVRDEETFKDYADYHFYQIPEGSTAQTMTWDLMASRDAHTLIDQVPQRILNRKVPRAEKIIWLRYLIHVIGDVHQPLHVGNGLDFGANLCDIKYQRPGSSFVESNNLHSFWDTKIFSFITSDYENRMKTDIDKAFKAKAQKEKLSAPQYWKPNDLAAFLLLENSDKITMASAQAQPEKWYDDSRSLHPQVYPEPVFQTDPAQREYCKVFDKTINKVVIGKYSADKIPTLTDAYITRAMGLVKQQVILAGFRTADTLNTLGAKYIVANKVNLATPLNPGKILLSNQPGRGPQSEKGLRHSPPIPWPHCD